MSEKAGKLRGRRGAVLLCAGALLGAVIAGPGATIAQKMTGSTTKTTKFVRSGTILTAGKTEEAKISAFSSTTFSPIAQATIKAPGPGTLQIVGSVSAKDDGVAAGFSKLQFRLKAGSTPLSTTPESFELFLPALVMPTDDGRENGSVNGVAKVSRKGQVPIILEAQKVSGSSDAQILGRSVSAVFIPKGKAKAKPKGKGPTGKTPVGP